MTKIAVVFLLLFATFAWAAAEPNPEEYTTNVHVSSSRLVACRSEFVTADAAGRCC
jgi:hypothetical protein